MLMNILAAIIYNLTIWKYAFRLYISNGFILIFFEFNFLLCEAFVSVILNFSSWACVWEGRRAVHVSKGFLDMLKSQM